VLVEPLESEPPAAAGAPEREGGLYRYSAAHFLAMLIVLLVTMPFMQDIHYGQAIEAALMTLVLLSAVPAVGGRRRTLIKAMVLVTPAVVGTWLHHWHPHLLPRGAVLTVALVFVAFVVYHLVSFILRSPQVDSQVLCAGISTYLMLGLFWAFAHALVALLVPQSYVFIAPHAGRPMTGFDAVYFSFSTLTTVAYGDIMPVSSIARMLAMVEATTGLFYVTVMIARLVALYSASSATRSKEN